MLSSLEVFIENTGRVIECDSYMFHSSFTVCQFFFCGLTFPPLFSLRLCSYSGHAAYATAVDLYPKNTGVGATYFMTYHTILKESPDYIHALKMARNLANNISQSMDHKVFAYR